MFTQFELANLGFIPKTKYKLGQPFPVGFTPPAEITDDTWKKIPLYIQVRYSYTSVEGKHTFNI